MACLKIVNGTYYIQFYVGKRQKRLSLRTKSKQIAKEKIRQYESAQLRGADNPLPSNTPLGSILDKYTEHLRARKTAKSAQTDIYYLRSIFGEICDGLKITSRKVTNKVKLRPTRNEKGRIIAEKHIQANNLESVTSSQIADFIACKVKEKGLAPKTANRYREILSRLFNWAMNEGGVKMPGDKNPASKVEKYRERASEISFLTMTQITEQLNALRDTPQLQVMVAMLIYAGLRREEVLWLTREDVSLRKGMISVRAKTINDQYWEPKTKVNRAVPISKALREFLTNYTPRPSIGGWYFPSPKGTHYDPDNFSRELRRTNKTARLKWTCLDYRHTFGSQLAMKGESLYKISKLMGNSPEICRRHYAAVIPESLMDCVDFETQTNPARYLG